MRKVKTGTLLILGVLLFFAAGLLQVGVDVFRPVKDSSGAQLYRPDGRMLMETDTWGNIRVNWQSDFLFLLSAIIFLWCLIRFARSLFRKSRA